MSSKKPAINISVPCSHRGLHYQGASLQDGVNLEVIDAPCGPARQMLKFSNCKEGSAPEGIFFDQVSCIDDELTQYIKDLLAHNSLAPKKPDKPYPPKPIKGLT